MVIRFLILRIILVIKISTIILLYFPLLSNHLFWFQRQLGTLSPICKHPDLAVIPTETKKILERLANRRDVFLAIISGRSVANVKQMVGIEGELIENFI